MHSSIVFEGTNVHSHLIHASLGPPKSTT